MESKKCIVIREELSEKDILKIREEQKSMATRDSRSGNQTAFEKALTGSKLYLKGRRCVDPTES